MKTNGYGLVAVTIIKGIEIYQPGQIAGFVPDIAKKLIDRGFAELYKEGLGDPVQAFAAAEASHTESQSMLATLKATAAAAPAAAPEAPAQVETAAAAEGSDGNGGAPAPTGDIKVMGIDDEVVIPAGWMTELHHTQIKALARQITGESYEDKAKAIEVINTAINARTAA